MLAQLQFAFTITGPILVLLLVGIYLRRIKLIDEHFIQVGNALVFKVTLPLLLFFGMASHGDVANLKAGHVLFGSVATLGTVGFLLLLAPLLVSKGKVGVFVQGAFRGNMGIVGLALVLNAYGGSAISIAAVYVGGVTIIYNVVAVWLLGSRGDSLFKRISHNPLILAICAGFVYSLAGVPVPAVLASSGDYLGNITLPLALLCIGGSLSWESFKSNHKEVLVAVALKLVLTPFVVIVVAIALNFRDVELGVLFFMFASPTATASYVMAKQMTKHGDMAAEIVALGTILSSFTLTIGLVILKAAGFV